MSIHNPKTKKMTKESAENSLLMWSTTYHTLSAKSTRAIAKTRMQIIARKHNIDLSPYGIEPDSPPAQATDKPTCKNTACNKQFEPINQYQLFCSKTCKNHFHNNKHKQS
jgi:hypothetical protein